MLINALSVTNMVVAVDVYLARLLLVGFLFVVSQTAKVIHKQAFSFKQDADT